MRHINPRHCDILTQQGRAHGRCDLTNLRAAYMDAITVLYIDITVDFETHQFARRGFLAADQCVAANEIIGLGFQRYSEANARFKNEANKEIEYDECLSCQ